MVKSRTHPPIVTLLLLLALTTASTGCLSSNKLHPIEQVTLARRAYTIALQTLTAARQAGLISDEAKASIDRFRVAAAAALDELEAAAISGNTNSFDVAMKIVEATLTKLITEANNYGS